MANIDTVKSVTDNLQTVLDGLGIKFSRETYNDTSKIPASLIPFGQIFYAGESFEYTHGQKAEYAEIEFLIKVRLKSRDPVDRIREQQIWVHKIRDGLTVNALNIADLVTSKLISRVTTESVTINNISDLSTLDISIRVRYREA